MMYTQLQRFIATLLLFSILLQSCGTPNWKVADDELSKGAGAKTYHPSEVRRCGKVAKLIQEQHVSPEGSLVNRRSTDTLAELSGETSPVVYVESSSVPAVVSEHSPLMYASPQHTAASNVSRSTSTPLKAAIKHTTPNPRHVVLDKPLINQQVNSKAKQMASEHVTDPAPYAMEKNKSLPVILPVAPLLYSRIFTQECANTTLQSSPAVVSIPFSISPSTQVAFRQVDDCWQAIVQEKIGSFSRELRLPVVSEEDIETALANLAGKKAAYIKSRIHLLDTDQASKVVYLGEMGLLGGGFWRSFGRALGRALLVGVACVAVGALVVASGGTLAIGFAGLSGMVGVGLFAGFGTILTFGLVMNAKLQARQTVLDEISIAASGFVKTDHKITSSIESLIERLDTQLARQRIGATPSSSGGYEYTNRADYLKKLEEHKTQIQDQISRLERYRNHQDLWDKDKPGVDEKIRDREQMLRYINEKIEEVNQKLRDQAREVFEQNRKDCEREYRTGYDQVKGALCGITAAEGPARANDSFASMYNCLNTNIGHYESWAQEPALFAADQEEIENIRTAEEQRQATHRWTRQLIDYATADEDNGKMLQIISQAASIADLNRHCSHAIRDGQVLLVRYAIEHNALPVNSADRKGDTLLHQAVRHNQADIVSYLVMKGANKSAVNSRGATPLSLARASNNAAIIALLE